MNTRTSPQELRRLQADFIERARPFRAAVQTIAATLFTLSVITAGLFLFHFA